MRLWSSFKQSCLVAATSVSIASTIQVQSSNISSRLRHMKNLEVLKINDRSSLARSIIINTPNVRDLSIMCCVSSMQITRIFPSSHRIQELRLVNFCSGPVGDFIQLLRNLPLLQYCSCTTDKLVRGMNGAAPAKLELKHFIVLDPLFGKIPAPLICQSSPYFDYLPYNTCN